MGIVILTIGILTPITLHSYATGARALMMIIIITTSTTTIFDLIRPNSITEVDLQ